MERPFDINDPYDTRRWLAALPAEVLDTLTELQQDLLTRRFRDPSGRFPSYSDVAWGRQLDNPGERPLSAQRITNLLAATLRQLASTYARWRQQQTVPA